MQKFYKNLFLLILLNIACFNLTSHAHKAELVVQTGHSGRVNSIAYSPDGKMIASGSSDKTIKLWNSETLREIRTLTGHADSVNSVLFSPDGKTIISGSSDKTIRVWDVNTGNELKIVQNENPVDSITISPDGKSIASHLASEKAINLFD